jgi:oxalate decarboxylase
MMNPTLPSFRYRLEQQPPHTSCGGLVRGASVQQFPVSQGIAGASMRLQPGCLRELHCTRLLRSWVTSCLAVAAPLY